MTIGEELRRIRELRKISLRRAAIRASISAPSLSRLENGIIDPTPDDLRRLSSIYQVEYHSLLAIAGYLDGEQATLHRGLLAEIAVSEEEAEELLRYLEYLRWRKGKDGAQG